MLCFYIYLSSENIYEDDGYTKIECVLNTDVRYLPSKISIIE